MSARAALAAVAVIDDMFAASSRSPTATATPPSSRVTANAATTGGGPVPRSSLSSLASPASSHPTATRTATAGSTVNSSEAATADSATTAVQSSSPSTSASVAEQSEPSIVSPVRFGRRARPSAGELSASALKREEAKQLRAAIELSKQEMETGAAEAAAGRSKTDSGMDIGVEADVPSPEPRKRKRGRPPTRKHHSTPAPTAAQIAAAASRTGRRPNYKEASDDDDFDVPAADDEVDAADDADDAAAADDDAADDDDDGTGERDQVLESLLIEDGEADELQRKFRDRIGKGVTLVHLERYFGPDSIPDEYYGLNGWLGRLPAGRIVARRFINGRHSTFRLSGLGGGEEESGGEGVVDGCFWYLYWVKGTSYLHCRWIAEHHFMQLDESTGRITHFMKKRTADEIELDVSLIPQPDTQLSQQSSSVMEEDSSDHTSTETQHEHKQAPSAANSDFSQPPTATTDVINQPSTSHSADTASDTADTQPPQPLSDADKEAAVLAAFLSKEDDRKLARIRDIADERDDIRRRARLLPLFDPDWLAVDRVVDHRRKRRERRKNRASNGVKTRKEMVEEQVEDYQKSMHAFALKAIQTMQQQQLQNGSNGQHTDDDSEMAVTVAENGRDSNSAEEEAMENETGEASEDEEDGPLADRRRVEYEFLIQWKKLPYDQCTWETFSFLSAAHVDAQQLATPLASPTPPSSSLYVSAVRDYLAFVSPTAVRSASWIIPHNAKARVAEAKVERLSARKDKLHETVRRAEQRKKAKQEHSSSSSEHSPLEQQEDDEELKDGEEEDETSSHHFFDSDDERRYSRRRASASPSPTPTLPPPEPAPSNLSSLSSRPPVTASMRFGPSGLTLRPYQVDGVNWIVLNWLTDRNCILADEMGLGTMNSLQHTTSLPHLLSTFDACCFSLSAASAATSCLTSQVKLHRPLQPWIIC